MFKPCGTGIALCVATASLLIPGSGHAVRVDVEAPAIPNPDAPPPFKSSYARVPIQVPLTFLSEALERELPRETGTDGEYSTTLRDDTEIRFEARREPLTLTIESDMIDLAGALNFRVEARGDFDAISCGIPEPMTGMLTARARIGWLDGWMIGTSTTHPIIGWRKRCKPKPPGINFTKIVNGAIRTHMIDALPEIVDRTAPQSSALRDQIARAWEALQEPIDVGRNDMWLAFNPTGVVADPLVGADGKIATHVSVSVAPRIRIGDRPAATPVPLPDTRVRLSNEQLAVAFDCGIPLTDIVHAIHSTCASITRPELSAPIEVEKVTVTGGEDRVVVALTLAGEVEGTIYLSGRPTYDPQHTFLALADFDYTNPTKAALGSLGETNQEVLWDALEQLRTCVEVSFRHDIGDGVVAYLGALGASLNRSLTPDVRLQGGINDRRAVGTFVSDKVVGVRLLALGKVTLIVQKPPSM